MDMKIEERDNPLFKRRDLAITISHAGSGTPSKASLSAELSSKYNVDPAQVVINYMFSDKGSNETKAKCKILNEKPKVVEKPKEEVKNEAQASPAA